jgi:UDP-2,3-diacylglucosamine pyrophosphatase LpxH
VVISDLHIGAGPLDDFDAAIELEFVSFMAEMARRIARTQLIINGDFLEFVQAEPWDDPALRGTSKEGHCLCFTEAQSLRKLEAIVKNHPNVFGALGRFLAANGENELVILPGNHDADFFWKAVRLKLAEVITRSAGSPLGNRLRFFLGQVYRPPSAPTIWIEHGHQHDKCNNFVIGSQDYWSEQFSPIFEGLDGEQRLIECVGTRFLLKFINRLDNSYPFIDNVKPFSKFIKMFGVSALRPDYGVIQASVAIWHMMKYVASTTAGSPSDFMSVSGKNPAAGKKEQPITTLLRNAWARMTSEEQHEVLDALESRNFRISSPMKFLLENDRSAARVVDALADNMDIAAMFPAPDPRKMSVEGTGKMSLIPGFFADESAELILAASAALRNSGATVVIMGHTHESQDHPRGLNYVNTGSWTRYLQASAGNEPSSWSLLRRDAAANFPYGLLYAEVAIADPQAVVLKTWRTSNAV